MAPSRALSFSSAPFSSLPGRTRASTSAAVEATLTGALLMGWRCRAGAARGRGGTLARTMWLVRVVRHRYAVDGWGVGELTVTDGIAVPPHWSVNFAVRDADAIAERAIGLGGTIVMAPMDTPGFRSAVIADPQGGVVAVSAARG